MIDSSTVIERPIMTDYIWNSPLLMRNRCFMRCCVTSHASHLAVLCIASVLYHSSLLLLNLVSFTHRHAICSRGIQHEGRIMEREKDGFMDANNIRPPSIRAIHRCFHVSNPSTTKTNHTHRKW